MPSVARYLIITIKPVKTASVYDGILPSKENFHGQKNTIRFKRQSTG